MAFALPLFYLIITGVKTTDSGVASGFFTIAPELTKTGTIAISVHRKKKL